ncbi:MAG: phosphoribosylformylglycinamidine synthase subunit PurL [bacterium]
MLNQESEVTLELAKEHGLSEEEYRRVINILGRIPTFTELGIFSVMWSEHCSYKNSIALLKTLPRSGKNLLVSAGEENAGLVDIGDGLAIAFKIESHNHPSAVEPYQGAATGVGGILRDIFTMGARPIAALNSLRFGQLSNKRVQYLFKNVVKGIGDYGNSFGVPTVAGEVYFDECYTGNPLVNAMAVGIVRHSKVVKAIAQGKDNLVMIVGSSTGRDGIHGATFASEEISEASEAKRPSVQVGDPFTEKLLLEATLEAIDQGLIIGIQDMGAAGLTCSSTEMSAKGKSGMILDLDKVPLREDSMSAYEIMLSESQERMLLVIEKQNEVAIRKVFNKWDLHAEVIGNIIDEDRIIIYQHNQKMADVPANALVLGGGAPVYHRDSKMAEYIKHVRDFKPQSITEPTNYTDILIQLLSSHNIASKQWVYNQYDSMVRTNTIDLRGDAAVIRIKGTEKAIAVKTDSNPRYVYLNPRRGAQIAVAEAARNVVCTGARPIAITNCLNFGNPYDPEVYWQFSEAVAGMAEACCTFETPVTGGNVSFYNESPDTSVYPTPIIGMLGLIDKYTHPIESAFPETGLHVIILGPLTDEIGGSEYLALRTGKCIGDAPNIDLQYEKRLQSCCLELIHKGLALSAHDCSEGGIAVAIAECVLNARSILGVQIDNIDLQQGRPDFILFGEGQSRIIISAKDSEIEKIVQVAESYKVECQVLGKTTTQDKFSIQPYIDTEVTELRSEYSNAIRKAMGD